MIIRELELIHFGKFHHYSIELGPRMNLLSGGNEAGKSTIYAFICGMLFGLRRARGRAAAGDMYNRFLPWDTPGSYEGCMVFEHGGRNYRMYRNFHKDQMSVSLICLDDSREIPLPHGVIGDFIPGLTLENFKNTMGIAQGHSEPDSEFALALQSQAANMAATGSQNLHLGRALEYLKKERLQLKKQSAADALQKSRENLQRLSTELQQLSGEPQRQNGEPQRRSEEPQRPGAAYPAGTKPQGGADASLSVSALEARLSAVREALEKCQMDQGIYLGQERQLQARLQELEAAADTGNRPAVQGGGPSDGADDVPDSRRRQATGFVATLMGILVGLGAVVNASRLSWWMLALCLALCLVLLILGIAGCIRAFFPAFVNRSLKRPADDGGSEDDSADGDKRENRAEQLELCRQKDLIFEKLKRTQENLEEQRKKKLRLEEEHRRLLEQEQQQRQKLLRQAWEQEKYQETLNAMEDCKEELERLTAWEAALKQECDCVDMAAQIIRGLAGEIHESFGSRLWERASQLMAEMTGHGRRFRVSPDLKLSVDNSKTFVPIDRLSRGTMEQFYLSLRLSAAGLLFDDNEVPLVMDDTFAYYDDRRLSALLAWLAEGWQGQILLFSCHHREGELMDGMNIDYNYVNLEDEPLPRAFAARY